jgi:hypothetical protein
MSEVCKDGCNATGCIVIDDGGTCLSFEGAIFDDEDASFDCECADIDGKGIGFDGAVTDCIGFGAELDGCATFGEGTMDALGVEVFGGEKNTWASSSSGWVNGCCWPRTSVCAMWWPGLGRKGSSGPGAVGKTRLMLKGSVWATRKCTDPACVRGVGGRFLCATADWRTLAPAARLVRLVGDDEGVRYDIIVVVVVMVSTTTVFVVACRCERAVQISSSMQDKDYKKADTYAYRKPRSWTRVGRCQAEMRVLLVKTNLP